MGTLAYSESNGGIVLQHELDVLNHLLSPLAITLDSDLAARLVLPAEPNRMAQAGDNTGIMDIKKNLRCLYKMVAIGIMDNKEIAWDIKKMEETVSYTSLQISNHDSRIDDNESSLREMMEKIDRIQEDLERLLTMNQGSRVQGATAAVDQPMEEESVV